jgi:hypothetical protein
MSQRAHWLGLMKTIKFLVAMGLSAGTCSAEVQSFRIGDSIVWFQDVLGFNILDLTSAIYDLITLLLLVGVAYIVWYRWIKK